MRWYESRAFCSWAVGAGYIRRVAVGDTRAAYDLHNTTRGLLLYMFEAWSGGVLYAPQEVAGE